MAKDLGEVRLEELPGPSSKEELEEMKMPYEDYCRKCSMWATSSASLRPSRAFGG